MKCFLPAFALLFVSMATVSVADEDWTILFNGENLDGWTQKNGTATYEIVDGTLLGTTQKGSPNSFLCTDEEYDNFELEFEVKVDDRLNSGVQIRSTTKGNDPNGRVNGPQVEIEASGKKGAEGGYIYGEATGRGWLTPKEDLKPHRNFKDGEWNHYRVLAVGPNIKTWINGEPVSNLTDDAIYETHPRGFIGLQVHRFKSDTPATVAWRNIKLRKLDE